MAEKIRPVPGSLEARKPDVIATPEGDGEFDPSEPLHPLPDGALQDPRGAKPGPYDRDPK